MPPRSTSDEPSAIARTIDAYLEEVAARTRASTRSIYQTTLRRKLLPWLEQEGITRVDQLDRRTLARWVTALREEHTTPQGKPLSEASVHTYATSVNLFMRWLEQQGTLAAGARAETPKSRQRVLDVLSREEIRHLEAGASTERDKLLIRVLADTGARLQEVLDLRDGDIVEPVRRQYAVKLGGKTGQRLVPITPALHRRLTLYIERGRPRDYHGSRIFVGLRKVDGRYQVPGRTTVAHMIREAAERAGIGRRVHAHLLRHSAITHQLRQGTNPILVARFAGHASLEMIRSTYAHLTLADEQAAMMRALSDDDE